MKKVLLGGTALVAAALIGSMPASAADSANVTSGLQMKISGFIGSQATLSLGDTETFDRDYDFQSSARLQFDVKNVTDSGLEYGGRIRFASVNRQDNISVDRTYVYLKGDFGTITFGNAPTTADDFGYVYAHDQLNGNMGLGAGFGDLLDGNFYFGGNEFFSIDATYLAGVSNSDTRIKYTSPTFNGFSFGVDFTPVIGGRDHAGNGGRNDLTNDGKTVYENVVSAGINYEQTFDDLSVRFAASAIYGNGVKTSNFTDGNANPDGHDLEVYTVGGQIGSGGILASVNWTRNEQTAAANKPVDTIIGDLSYQWGPFLASASYAYTWSDKGNGLNSSISSGEDLKEDHLAGVNLTYTLAPGLNTYGEVIYSKQNFRSGRDNESASLGTGIVIGF
jgi:predicted porin